MSNSISLENLSSSISFPRYTLYRLSPFHGENNAPVLRFFELEAEKASSDDNEPMNNNTVSPENYLAGPLVFSEAPSSEPNDEKDVCTVERRRRKCFKCIWRTKAIRWPFKKSLENRRRSAKFTGMGKYFQIV